MPSNPPSKRVALPHTLFQNILTPPPNPWDPKYATGDLCFINSLATSYNVFIL